MKNQHGDSWKTHGFRNTIIKTDLEETVRGKPNVICGGRAQHNDK